MPRAKYTTINIPTQTKDDLQSTAAKTAESLHMTNISLAQLINMMHGAWKEKLQKEAAK